MKYILAPLISTLVIGFNYYRNPFEFYNDDFQAQYFPIWYEIGRQISEGSFPLITNRIFYGNNLAGEFQYGVFNPIQLGISFLVYELIQLGLEHNVVATLLVYFYFTTLLFLLSKIISGFTRSYSSLFVSLITLSSSGVFSLWFLRNYIPALISLTFYTFFLLVMLKHYRYARKIYVFLLPFAIYLVISSGWPLQILALILTLVGYAVLLITTKRYKKFFELIYFGIVGGLLSLLPILPLSDYSKYEALRATFTTKSWSIHLEHWDGFFNPLVYKSFHEWNENLVLIHYPMLYYSILIPALGFWNYYSGTRKNYTYFLSYSRYFFLFSLV